jgi:NADH:ubiquinone oxidoreductase subunit E
VTTGVRQLLESFDALSETEKHEAAVELLRRVQREAGGAVSDEALVEAADQLFRELDAREGADAHGQSR